MTNKADGILKTESKGKSIYTREEDMLPYFSRTIHPEAVGKRIKSRCHMKYSDVECVADGSE